MNKLLYLILVLTLICCDSRSNQKNGTPRINELRKKNKEVFKKHASRAQNQPNPANEKCSCDPEFLGKFLSLQEYSNEIIVQFLCIPENACRDNIEFQELYNESLFKALESNPQLFVSYLSSSKSFESRTNLYEHFLNPINDSIDSKMILDSALTQVRSNLRNVIAIDELLKLKAQMDE